MPDKFDRVRMIKLLNKGMGEGEVAKELGVSVSAISHSKKELGISSTKVIQLERAAEITSKHIDATGQLGGINEKANRLLDKLDKEIGGEGRCEANKEGFCDSPQVEILVDALKEIAENGDSASDTAEKALEDALQSTISPDPKGKHVHEKRELMLKTMAEIRGQVKAYTDLLQQLFDIKAAAVFQEAVLTSIGEEAPDVRKRIVERLQRDQALRKSVTIGPHPI